MIREDLKLEKPVYVSRPTLPPRAEFDRLVDETWKNRWLSNHGPHARRFEEQVAAACGTPHAAVVANGTIALVLALRALGVEGRVLVPPLSFVGTFHALHWAGCTPVFADLEEDGVNLCPERTAEALTDDIAAIMAVHLFGHPCACDRLEELACARGIPVIYDAAHAMGVVADGRPLASRGAASALSFHATKLVTSVEGGAVCTPLPEVDEKVRLLRDFGFDRDDRVHLPGINGKMNELEAAMGLLSLGGMRAEIAARQNIFGIYRRELADVAGIRLLEPAVGVDWNAAYAPVLVDATTYGASADELQAVMVAHGMHPRRYFRPAGNALPWNRDAPGADAENLPMAKRRVRELLCLPIYGTLEEEVARKIVEVVRAFGKGAG